MSGSVENGRTDSISDVSISWSLQGDNGPAILALGGLPAGESTPFSSSITLPLSADPAMLYSRWPTDVAVGTISYQDTGSGYGCVP